MKKCPDCGMVIANQAIRCPKCKYTFTSAESGADTETTVTPQAAAVSAAAVFSFRFPFPGTEKGKCRNPGHGKQDQDIPDIHG